MITLLFASASLGAAAQDKDSVWNRIGNFKLATEVDSLNRKMRELPALGKYAVDSAYRTVVAKVGFINSKFQSSTDSLHYIYQSKINRLDSMKLRLNSKIYSVHKLGHSKRKALSGYKHKLDSVSRAKSRNLAEMNKQVDRLKSRASKELRELDVPPQLKAAVRDMEKAIGKYSIPVVNGKIPNLPSGGNIIPGIQIPGVNQNLNPNLNTNLSGLNTNLPGNGIPANGSLPDVSAKLNGFQGDANKLVNQNVNQIKNIDKTIEEKAMGTSELKQLGKETGELKALQAKTRVDSAALKNLEKEALNNLQKEATNHFADKGELVKESMSKVSALKAKYSRLNSIHDLPKKVPNPYKDLLLIERIVPFLTLQPGGASQIAIDLNPGANYLFGPRITAGIGWVERFAIGQQNVPNSGRLYGPRADFQFNWTRGFSLRLVPEVVNAYVPPQFIPTKNPGDQGELQWVASVFTGLKKDFIIYKKIKGTTEALYNLANPHLKNPYQDRLLLRFGFEFPMKKKRRVSTK